MKRVLVVLALVLGMGSAAHASSIVSLLGDKDCFGLGGSCPDGTLWRDGLGGVFFVDYSTASDPAFTDRWFSAAGITFNHTVSLGGATPTSAVLELRIAGVADSRGPWDVFVNSILVGQIPTNTGPQGFQEVKTYLFNLAPGTITNSNGVLLNINVPDAGDGYIIDYSELRVETGATEAPEPSSLLLLGAGLVALVYSRRPD